MSLDDKVGGQVVDIRTARGKKSKSVPVKNFLESCPDFFTRYIYVSFRDRIFDTKTGNEYTRSAFSGTHAHWVEDGDAAEIFLGATQAIKVDGLIYLPGNKQNPILRDDLRLWNIWHDPGIVLPESATDEQIEQFLEHLDFLFPNTNEQAVILDWFAFILQHPDVKINFALLIAGTSRVGKDLLLSPLRYGLGSANVSEPPASELRETFTDYLHKSKLVIFQEIQLFEGLNLENKLKPMLASPPETLRVRLFGRGFYETPNLVQAVFMSNYRDALHISEGDARYFAVWTDSKPLSADYYAGFAAWLDSGGSALVVRWLLSRDVSKFNPKAAPPSTVFKGRLIETSKSPLRHHLQEMIDGGDYPFNVDCVRSLDVAKTLRDKYSAKAIGQVLTEIGCLPMMCQRSTGKRERVSLFAVRNLEEWQKVENLHWINEYESRIPKPVKDDKPS
jgi:hypothetical protein